MNIIPIGIIHTPFTESGGTPIQPKMADGTEGTVEIFDEYSPGLTDIDGFERIWLLYWFDRAAPAQLNVVPYKDNKKRGVFATRAPARPNPIGLSSVRLISVKGNLLKIADVDMLDSTPLLDIKPYVPMFDIYTGCRAGWLDSSNDRREADNRFQGNTTSTEENEE